MEKLKILCVDDEIDNVDSLERLLRKDFAVIRAHSGFEAIEILDQHPGPIAAIITDQRMPQKSGVDVLEHSLKTHPHAVRILLTGYTDMESIIQAVNRGHIFRYINKPWDPMDMINTIRTAVSHFGMSQELEKKNAALEKAYAELQTLDEAKNHFMILVNHELRTPLTSMLSFGALLAESQLDDEQKMMVNRINQSAERLRNLIDDVLLIIRAETGNLKLELQTFRLESLDDCNSAEIEKIVSKKDLIIQRDVDPVWVRADYRLIKQVLVRIFHNAVKFCRSNSVVTLICHVHGDKVRIGVHNQGDPIPPKVLEKIFTPFYIDEDILNHSMGVGLGLTISQSILRNHQSGIQIENLTDGVWVYFELPIIPQQP